MRKKNILEGSGDEDMLSLIERTWWEKASLQRKERDILALGVWRELIREEVNGNPKVAIVLFLSLFFEFQPFVITLI